MNDYGRTSQNIQIQLPNGNVMNIPVDSSTASGTGSVAKGMNISEEVNRSGVWKTVNIGNVLPSDKPTCRNNRRREKWNPPSIILVVRSCRTVFCAGRTLNFHRLLFWVWAPFLKVAKSPSKMDRTAIVLWFPKEKKKFHSKTWITKKQCLDKPMSIPSSYDFESLKKWKWETILSFLFMLLILLLLLLVRWRAYVNRKGNHNSRKPCDFTEEVRMLTKDGLDLLMMDWNRP